MSTDGTFSVGDRVRYSDAFLSCLMNPNEFLRFCGTVMSFPDPSIYGVFVLWDGFDKPHIVSRGVLCSADTEGGK